MTGSVLDDKSFSRSWDGLFLLKLDWGSYLASIAKTALLQMGAFVPSIKFLYSEVALYLDKSTIRHEILLPYLG